MALLRGQVERGHSLLGQDVGVSAVLQQHCSDFHLVLLGCDVERGVAVLKQGQTDAIITCITQLTANRLSSLIILIYCTVLTNTIIGLIMSLT